MLNVNSLVKGLAAGRAEFVVDWLGKPDGSWAARRLRSRARFAPAGHAPAGGRMRGSMRAWRRGGRRVKALALAALMIWLSERTAAGDAGPETDNALATLCGIVESSAMAEGLPVGFFTRLIWRESAFKPNAVSPAGAQGVAQFMPRTASERGLADPFDPAAAIWA